jgi:hypothetical protein
MSLDDFAELAGLGRANRPQTRRIVGVWRA